MGPKRGEQMPQGLQEDRQRALAIRRLTRNKMALAGGAILVLMIICALAAPVVSPYEPTTMDLNSRMDPPTLAHPLGTDFFGRDVLTRMIYGARVSLFIGLASVSWAALAGIPMGLVSGYFGGAIGGALMRMVDALLSFPPLLLAIAISGSLGGGQGSVILALGLIYVPVFARLVRGNTLSLREADHVMAARSYGASDALILFKHILPNLIGIIVVQATVGFSSAVISEATLSFLGLGVPPPLPSWGRDMNDGRAYARDAWWLIIVPAATIVINVLGINFLGDGLRDALDPRTNPDA
jgi:peptide/nickel transport system permease protein